MRFVDVERFDGGLVDSSIDIGEESINMIRYGQNIRTRGGAIKSRDGITEYCDFHLAVGIMGNNIGPMYEYKREAGDIYYAIVFSVGTAYYYVEPEDDPDVAVSIGSLTSGDFYALNYFDHLFIANGEDALKTWDGQNLYNAGIEGPASFTAASVAGLLNIGYRKYKYTYYRDGDPYDKESPPSVERQVDLNGGKSALLTLTPSADPQVTHIYVYATEAYADPADPATEFYRLAELPAATTTYTDVADSFTGVAYDTTDRTPPPVLTGIIEIDNRIYGWGPDDPSIVYYSEIGKPWYWGANNWDEVNRDDGDIITGIAAIGLVKFIFKQNSIYQWNGDPSFSNPIIPVERPDATQNMNRVSIGCKYPRTLAGWGNSLIFMTSAGQVYQLTMSDIIYLSELVQEDIKDLTNTGDSPRSVIHNDYLIINSDTHCKVCDLRRGQTGWDGKDVYANEEYPNNWLIDHNGYCLGSFEDYIYRYYDDSVKTDNGETPIKIVQPFYYKAVSNAYEGIFRRVIVNDQNRSNDYTMSIYVDGVGISSLVDNLYEATDRWFSINSGCRGHYLSARLQWTDAQLIIRGASYGLLLGARH